MDSANYLTTFRTLVGLIAFSLVAAIVLAIAGKLSAELMVLLNGVILASYARMDHQAPKSVTIDNKASDPVPTTDAAS